MSHRVGLHIGSRSRGIGRALHVIAGVAASASVMAACSSSRDSSGDGAGRGGTESVVTVSVDVVEADAPPPFRVQLADRDLEMAVDRASVVTIVFAPAPGVDGAFLSGSWPDTTVPNLEGAGAMRFVGPDCPVDTAPFSVPGDGVGRPICSVDPTSIRVGEPVGQQPLGTGSLYDDELTVTVVPVIWAEGNYQSDAAFRWLVPATPASGGRLAQATIRLTLTTHSGGVPPGNDAETSRPPSR